MEYPSVQVQLSRVLYVLEALKQASVNLQVHLNSNLVEFNSSAIKALLELKTESDALLSKDIYFSTLFLNTSPTSKPLSKPFLDPAGVIASKSSWHGKPQLTPYFSSRRLHRDWNPSLDWQRTLWKAHEHFEDLDGDGGNKDKLVKLLTHIKDQAFQGFNRKLQDLVLKSKVFSLLEKILYNSNCLKSLTEQSAYSIASVIRFNKDVFMDQVLMSLTIPTLLTMSFNSFNPRFLKT